MTDDASADETTAEVDPVEDPGKVSAAEADDIADEGTEVEGDTMAPTLTRDQLGTGGRSKLPIILLVVAALLAGFIGGRVTAPDDDGSETATGGDTTNDEALAFPSGDQNRTGYWGFAGLEPVAIDTFDRADDPSSLGQAGSGQRWESVNGTWGIRDDAALTRGGAGDEPFLAVIPQGTGNGLTEVTMTVVEQGAGLVFRYLDARNYWSVTANPGVGSWSVNRVIDGESELVGEALGPTNDGVTISTTQDGSTVRVLLEGEEKLSLTDAALGEQLQGGIIAASTTTGQARWDRFLVMRFRGADAATTTTAAP